MLDLQLCAENKVISGLLSLIASHKMVIGSVPLRITTYLIIMKYNLHKDMDYNYIVAILPHCNPIFQISEFFGNLVKEKQPIRTQF